MNLWSVKWNLESVLCTGIYYHSGNIMRVFTSATTVSYV